MKRWLPYAATIWAFGYGALRTYWAAGNRPWFPPIGPDLIAFSGWGAVVLCAAVAVVAVGLGSGRGGRRVRWTFVGIGWLAAAGLAAASGALLPATVTLLFPGLGSLPSLGGLASQLGCLSGAVLIASMVRSAQRELRSACPRCGRTTHSGTPERSGSAVPAPRWALLAGYVAVAACLTREAAQAVVGFGTEANPYADGSMVAAIAFLVAFTLAGTLLPLALVHNWGQVWPRWTLWLAGRWVPRWLVLGPAFAVSGGITFYFGAGFVQLLVTPASTQTDGELGQTFLWVAVSAYLVWGLALGVATISYYTRTRPACRYAFAG